ncbi:uncharacterized protein BDV17DRAFT_261761 [Aspergillus undulatus]|uniref:uncharacterized protein n=1 Tax=Aspergillus undulatus TaxID=1810928 RepID=UPI003CCCB465
MTKVDQQPNEPFQRQADGKIINDLLREKTRLQLMLAESNLKIRQCIELLDSTRDTAISRGGHREAGAKSQ